MTAAYHHTGFFSIKNPTIESEVSWSSLLSFYTLEEQSFQQWPKKCMLHAEHTAGSSDHISFRAESGLSEDPFAQYTQRRSLSPKCPFGNLLIPESVE